MAANLVGELQPSRRHPRHRHPRPGPPRHHRPAPAASPSATPDAFTTSQLPAHRTATRASHAPANRTQITAPPNPVVGSGSFRCPERSQERRVWDSNPRGSSRLLAIFKTSHAIFLTCTDALPRASLGAYLARPGGHRVMGLTVPADGERTATHCHAGLAPIRRQCRIAESARLAAVTTAAATVRGDAARRKQDITPIWCQARSDLHHAPDWGILLPVGDIAAPRRPGTAALRCP